jgi:hypothetical protein
MVDLGRELWSRVRPDYIAALDRDEQAVIEAATGEMGNRADAVKLGWLKMRTKETWTKQRYTVTVRRALDKLRAMVDAGELGRRG